MSSVSIQSGIPPPLPTAWKAVASGAETFVAATLQQTLQMSPLIAKVEYELCLGPSFFHGSDLHRIRISPKSTGPGGHQLGGGAFAEANETLWEGKTDWDADRCSTSVIAPAMQATQ